MKSQRSYLLRALYDWIVDSDCTPHLLVDAVFPGVIVPSEVVQDGRVVLNVAPRAVQALVIAEDHVCFECRFSGRPATVEFPPEAVLAIYAKENGAGMAFEPVAPENLSDGEPGAAVTSEDDGDDEPPSPGRGSHLKVVK